MSKIQVRFTRNTRSMSLNDAIAIAENNEHYMDENFYYVHFEEANNELEELLSIIKVWKTTKLYYDDNDVDVKSFMDTFYCREKLFCNGTCKYIGVKWRSIRDIINEINIENGIGDVDKNFLQLFTPFLTRKNEKQFTLNKAQLIDHLKEKWFFQIEFCPIIDFEKSLIIIGKMPVIFEVRDRFSEVREVHYPDARMALEEIINLENDNGIDEEYHKRIAEIYAKIFEKRLRKILRDEIRR